MSVRERIKAIQKELLSESTSAAQTRAHMLMLTGLLGNVTDEERQADHDYKLILHGCLQSDEAANRSRIRAEVTPQYQRLREATDTKNLVIEMIRSCKVYLRSLEEEMRLQR